MSNDTQTTDCNILAEGITKRFNHHTVVSDISLRVDRGEIFGFIGPSGSGKTVTIRMLTGVYAPSSGHIAVLGEEPTKFHRKTLEKIGYLPQSFVLFPNLSVVENMKFVASLYGVNPLKRRKAIRESLEFVDLWTSRKKLASQLSGGMQRRMELASALTHHPQLVFADEPTAGVDPILREHFWTRFKDLRDEGRTLFITTQYVTEAAYCDHVALMSEGQIIANGTPDELRRRALGGEAIDMRAKGLTPATVETLENLSGVLRVEVMGFEQIRVYVENSGEIIPRLLNVVQSHDGSVMSVDEYNPNFDEVFVRLVESSRQDETSPDKEPRSEQQTQSANQRG